MTPDELGKWDSLIVSIIAIVTGAWAFLKFMFNMHERTRLNEQEMIRLSTRLDKIEKEVDNDLKAIKEAIFRMEAQQRAMVYVTGGIDSDTDEL